MVRHVLLWALLAAQVACGASPPPTAQLARDRTAEGRGQNRRLEIVVEGP